MHDLYVTAISTFMGFFAIMNPIANTVVFTGMTGECDAGTRRGIAFKALLTAFCIVMVFALLGKSIFELFGITLPALRIAGGILVFQVGYEMLKGRSSAMHSNEHDHQDASSIAISPLAVPILAGPGTIATAMNFSAAGSFTNIIVTLIAFASLCVISFFCFIYGSTLTRWIGSGGINIITRMMGLILAVIGVQMLLQGGHDAINLFNRSAG